MNSKSIRIEDLTETDLELAKIPSYWAVWKTLQTTQLFDSGIDNIVDLGCRRGHGTQILATPGARSFAVTGFARDNLSLSASHQSKDYVGVTGSAKTAFHLLASGRIHDPDAILVAIQSLSSFRQRELLLASASYFAGFVIQEQVRKTTRSVAADTSPYIHYNQSDLEWLLTKTFRHVIEISELCPKAAKFIEPLSKNTKTYFCVPRGE